LGLLEANAFVREHPTTRTKVNREREYEKLEDDDNSLSSCYGIPRKEFSDMNINQESAEAKRDENWMGELPVQKEEEEKYVLTPTRRKNISILEIA